MKAAAHTYARVRRHVKVIPQILYLCEELRAGSLEGDDGLESLSRELTDTGELSPLSVDDRRLPKESLRGSARLGSSSSDMFCRLRSGSSCCST